MENYIKCTVEEAVEKLVTDEINNWSVNYKETSYLEYLLEFGFKGYYNYTDEELEEELKERFGNKYKIIYDL
jgi:hypothetical protein